MIGKRMTTGLVLLAVALAGCTVAQAKPHPTPIAAPTKRPTAQVHPTPTPLPTSCTVSGTQGDSLNVRALPSKSAEIIAGLLPGDTVQVLAQVGNWYKIHPTGFVSRDYCK